MQGKSPRTPFNHLGRTLRILREEHKQSVAEVSGAVEVDEHVLQRIESGEEKPSEDILLLLISYFDVQDDEATRLMEMAGYLTGDTGDRSIQDATNIAFVMPMDMRVVYTDNVHVSVNNFGVMMNFMQGGGPNNQPLAVARIGMSKEHARSVISVLQDALDRSEQPPKQLKPPRRAKSNDV